MADDAEPRPLLDDATRYWRGEDSARAMANELVEVIVDLVGDRATVPPAHPVEGYLSDLAALGATGPTRDLAGVTSRISKLALDLSSWLELPERAASDRVAELDPTGELAARLRDGNLWEDAIHELFVLGLLIAVGHEAGLVAGSGMPDIRVVRPDGDLFVEAKRIHSSTPPKRVRRVLAKASKQIRAGGATCGLAVIHVDRAEPRARLGDGIPSDIEPYVAMARRELSSNSSKAVAHAIIFWDDHTVMGDVDVAHVAYARTRRSTVVSRPDGHDRVDVGPFSEMGSTLVAALNADAFGAVDLHTVEGFDGVRFGEDFAASRAGRHGVRTGMVLEALRDPTAIFQDEDFTLVSRHVTSTAREHVLLIIARRAGEDLVVSSAYKVPGPADEIEALAREPVRVLVALLNMCGHDLWIGGPENPAGILVVRAQLPLAPDQDMPVLGSAELGERRTTIQAMLRRSADAVELSWAFAIDEARYEAALAAWRAAGK